MQRLSTQNLTIRKCGWRSHHTLRAEEDAKHGRVVQCIIHVFFKDVFIGALPTVSLKKQPSEQNRESNKIHGKNSTFLFSFSAADSMDNLKVHILHNLLLQFILTLMLSITEDFASV